MSTSAARTSSSCSSPLDDDGLLAAALIAAANRRLAGVIAPTPVWSSSAQRAWLKLENLQVTGAYKVRGAYNALAARSERGERGPVFAASAGNHGLGVAWAARRLGRSATVVVPDAAPRTKVAGCRALGAEVRTGGEGFDGCLALARRLAGSSGALVHAFDDPEVIAGQATLASELLPLAPDVVVVPVGGGGLLAGALSVLRRAGIRVVGVQVAGVDAFRRAHAGEAPRAPGATVADGLRVSRPGALPLQIAAAVELDDLVVVEEEEVAAAVRRLAFEDKIVAEGAGAVAVAALPRVPGERRVAVVTGGNIDAAAFAALSVQAA